MAVGFLCHSAELFLCWDEEIKRCEVAFEFPDDGGEARSRPGDKPSSP